MTGLIADIGATNARFANIDNAGNITSIDVLPCADFQSLTDAARTYLTRHKITVTRAALAIAAPITGSDEFWMTNHSWIMSQKKIKADLGLEWLRVINDFTAIAYSVPVLANEDYYTLKEGKAQKGAPIGIVGPGTGLGVAAIVFDEQDRPVPVTTEGGHVTMHAHTQREFDIIEHLKKTKYHHVSAERLISGKGIVNLYQAICGIDGKKAEKNDPSDITQAALQNTCPVCVETLNTFASLLGSVAGNYALSIGALGGIYIAGGIVPKLGDWFKTSGFNKTFSEKGRYRDYLSAIPVSVITHPYPGFIGLKALASGS